MEGYILGRHAVNLSFRLCQELEDVQRPFPNSWGQGRSVQEFADFSPGPVRTGVRRRQVLDSEAMTGQSIIVVLEGSDSDICR